MANTPTTNFGYNKPTVGDRGWGTTQNNNLDAIDTDFAAEHRSGSGNDGKHGPKVTIVQSGADNALVITKSDTGSADVVSLINSGIGYGINIAQNANSRALSIDKTATGAGGCIVVGNSGTGAAIYVGQAGEAPGCTISKSSTGAQNTLAVINAGTGDSIKVQQDGDGMGLDIAKTNTGIANCIQISNSGTGHGISVTNANTAGAGNGILITNSGTAAGLKINQTGASNCIWVEKAAGTAYAAVTVTNSGDGYGINIQHVNTANTAAALNIINSSSADSILDDSGAKLTAAGSWTSVSTRISKQNLEELSVVLFKDADENIVDIGEKIDAVKVYRFESKRVPGYKHIGVMAEDFYEVFGVGEDNKTISATDVAAILWHEVQRLRKRVQSLEDRFGA